MTSISPKKNIRLAVLATEAHRESLRSIAPRLKGAEILDVNCEFSQAIAASNVDAVVIDGLNPTAICQSAELGKHILADMPVADSIDEIKEIISLCRTNDVTLMAGQSMRFLPSIVAVKTSVESGQLGEPGLLRIHSWRADAAATLVERIVREVDLANWMFGRLPTAVYCVCRSSENEQPAAIQIHLGFKNAMAVIDVSINSAEYFSLSMIGSTGAAYADDHHNMQLIYRGEQPSAIKTTTGNFHVLAQLQEFVDAIVEKREPSVSAVDNGLAVLVANAAIDSMKTGEALHLSGSDYKGRNE